MSIWKKKLECIPRTLDNFVVFFLELQPTQIEPQIEKTAAPATNRIQLASDG